MGDSNKSIYIIQNKTGKIKIGCSKEPEKRIRTIETISGVEIVNKYITEKCKNAFEIEKIMHEHYANKRLLGEWFDVDFEKACNFLERKMKKEGLKLSKTEKAEQKQDPLEKFIYNLFDKINIKNKIDCNQDYSEFSPIPPVPYWHRKNHVKIQKIIEKYKINLDDFYDDISCVLCCKFNLTEAFRLFEKQIGRSPYYASELIGFFPELSKEAEEYMDEMLEAKEIPEEIIEERKRKYEEALNKIMNDI